METNDNEKTGFNHLMLGRMDFLKFKNAQVISVQGEKGLKKGVFIPIDDNHIYVSTDGRGGAKGAYFDFICYRCNNLRFGNTHALKISLPLKVRQQMTDEEFRSFQYFGNLYPPKKSYEATPMQTPDNNNPAVDNYPSPTPMPAQESKEQSVVTPSQKEEQRVVKKPLKPLDWDDTDDLPF